MRHADNKRHERAEYISIHAPLAGCDRLQAAGWREGGISIHAPLAGCDSPPAHGALFVDISIHAPLAGCDNIQCVFAVSACYFNPRTPCGVRRRLSASATPPDNHFNPRTPCGVRRAKSTPAIFFVPISIHAPLAGCDGSEVRRNTVKPNFNPRTPCGVRQTGLAGDTSWTAFQSTHPLRGATAKLVAQYIESGISIHAPLAGCDFFSPPTRCV